MCYPNSSGGRKCDMGLTGLKPKSWLHSFRRLQGELSPCLFQLPEDSCIHRLVAHSSTSKPVKRTSQSGYFGIRSILSLQAPEISRHKRNALLQLPESRTYISLCKSGPGTALRCACITPFLNILHLPYLPGHLPTVYFPRNSTSLPLSCHFIIYCPLLQ